MVRKGRITMGSKVKVTLTAQGTNQNSATLSVGLGVDPDSNQNETVSPNGSKTIEIDADKSSNLEIRYTFGSPAEGGSLEVRQDNALKDAAAVSGEDSWLYIIR